MLVCSKVKSHKLEYKIHSRLLGDDSCLIGCGAKTVDVAETAQADLA